MRDSEGTGSRLPRHVIWVVSVLLSFGLQPERGLTQNASDPMEKCSGISDSAARLACFDSEMRRRHAADQPTHVPPAAAARPPAPAQTVPSTGASVTTARSRAPDDTIGLDGRQLILKRKSEELQPAAPAPFEVTLSRLTQRPGHQYSFALDNGQVWESTDAAGDLFLNPHESLTIRPGVMGAFFLKTKSGVSIRIHRVR